MSEPSWIPGLRAYYRSPGVRARIAEYCGGHGDQPDTFSCWSLAAYGGERRLSEVDGGPTPVPKAELGRLFDEGADVCRSLVDLGGTLLDLDVDYVNPGDPGESYRSPELVLRRLLPVYHVLREIFAAHRVRPRVLLSGRGIHFTLRAPLGSSFQAGLVEIGPINDSIRTKLSGYGVEPALAERLARGHEGAGRLLEHVAHLALHRLRGHTEVETTLADVAPSEGGPFVCLDLSAYADPLFERYLRCAFSSNQKAGLQATSAEHPCVFTLPVQAPISRLLRLREDGPAAAAWADSAVAAIPDTRDAPALLEAYRHGPVKRFHRDFYDGPRIEPAQWPFTYDRLTDYELPACVRAPLEAPNPLLLRPAFLRSVAFTLWGLGWHPRSIAGIVTSRFEKHHGWCPSFERYDAHSRAEFYVRLFCGALADGLEHASDFSCESQRGRGVCDASRCTRHDRALLRAAAAGLAKEEQS